MQLTCLYYAFTRESSVEQCEINLTLFFECPLSIHFHSIHLTPHIECLGWKFWRFIRNLFIDKLKILVHWNLIKIDLKIVLHQENWIFLLRQIFEFRILFILWNYIGQVCRSVWISFINTTIHVYINTLRFTFILGSVRDARELDQVHLCRLDLASTPKDCLETKGHAITMLMLRMRWIANQRYTLSIYRWTDELFQFDFAN